MLTGNREFYPLSHVYSVITDSFQILGDHEQIQRKLCAGFSLTNQTNDVFFHLLKMVIHYIIILKI